MSLPWISKSLAFRFISVFFIFKSFCKWLTHSTLHTFYSDKNKKRSTFAPTVFNSFDEDWVAILNIPLGTSEVESKKTRPTPVRTLLPHEVLDALSSTAAPIIFDSTMLGNYSEEARESFWSHIKSLDPWRDHPIFQQDGICFSKLIPVTLHADGAVMKREDEAFVYSWSSAFSHFGSLKEILMVKFPIAIIPERHMRSKKASRF